MWPTAPLGPCALPQPSRPERGCVFIFQGPKEGLREHMPHSGTPVSHTRPGASAPNPRAKPRLQARKPPPWPHGSKSGCRWRPHAWEGRHQPQAPRKAEDKAEEGPYSCQLSSLLGRWPATRGSPREGRARSTRLTTPYLHPMATAPMPWSKGWAPSVVTPRTRQVPSKRGAPDSKMSQKQTPKTRRTEVRPVALIPRSQNSAALARWPPLLRTSELRMPTQPREGAETRHLLPTHRHEGPCTEGTPARRHRQQQQRAQGTEAAGAASPGLGARAPGLTVREGSVDLLSSDLALRCGDRGEAEASGRGASLGRSCGREQPRQHQPAPGQPEPREGRAAGPCSGRGGGALPSGLPQHLCP